MAQTILVTGAGGQLGQELARRVPEGFQCVAMDRGQLDLADTKAVSAALEKLAPQQVINTAAYTAVDGAESDTAAAWLANSEAPRHIACACAQRGIRLLHISTDFVFDGETAHPYEPGSPTRPLGEYGRSKLAGEQGVMQECSDSLILRTSWLYSRFGGNFVKTMLRLMSEREELSVVCDQVGTPTWARGLADATWAAIARPALKGIYHWSDAGVCSWYDFAVAIYEESRHLGLLSRPVTILPIRTSEYPTPARRPAFSVLDKADSWRDFELEAVHWRQNLRAMLNDIQEQQDA